MLRWKEAEEFITQHGTIVKTPFRLLAAGAAGFHRTDLPEASWDKIAERVRSDAVLPVPHHCGAGENGKSGDDMEDLLGGN
jgi:hypothetical protein